jgi:hypothetical protein
MNNSAASNPFSFTGEKDFMPLSGGNI